MARVVAEAVPHHITQRGTTAKTPDDRRYCLQTLRAKSRNHGVAVLGDCAMTNHVHLGVR